LLTACVPSRCMPPEGEADFNLKLPVPEAGRQAPDAPQNVAAPNVPFMICDPLGVPRDLLNHAISMRGGIVFQPAGNRMLMLFEQQRVWRDVWMDGRELPKAVEAKGAHESR